jgi:hypothetical protein
MTNLATPDSGYRHIEIHPLSGAVGAEIHGVDIANGLSTVVFEEVQSNTLTLPGAGERLM